MISAEKENGNPTNFLNEIANFSIIDLDNTCLNKVTTGCGFTTMVLESEFNFVVCVPFTNLILNKVKWCEKEGIDVLAVFSERNGGAKDEEIKNFKGNKILVTWNSIKRLVNALGEKVNDYRLAIDESHKLIDAGAFRTNAIQDVIESHKKFKAFVLATATPIEEKYMHSEFKNLTNVHIKWHNLEPVNVRYSRYEAKKIKEIGAIIGLNHFTGITDGNAHIFLNSVNGIAQIIKKMKSNEKFDSSEIRIVAAISDSNNEKIKKIGLNNLSISSINDSVKKVNFYTSTAFEGCDIFDSLGKVYIISDGHRDCSKINITTQLPQIIGRIRDNKDKNKVELIYSPNKYLSHVSKSEFELALVKEREDCGVILDLYHEGLKRVSNKLNFTLNFSFDNNPFIIEREGTLTFNELAWNNELHNFDTIHKIYYVPKVEKEVNGKKKRIIPDGAKVEMVSNFISYRYDPHPQIEIKGSNKLLLTRKTSFKDLCGEYIEAKKSKFDLKGISGMIAEQEPIILDAYEKLGPDKMRALKFRKCDLKDEIIKQDHIISKQAKICYLLDLRVGRWISSEECKIKLQSIYDKLGIRQIAKATEIGCYYSCKEKKCRVNGVLKRGFVIEFSRFKKFLY